VGNERLPLLSQEALLDCRAPQESSQSAVGAAGDPLSLEVPLAAADEKQVDRLIERIPGGKDKLEHRFGPRQRIGSDRGDIKPATHC
jgi:hypothetical protein